MIKKINTIKSLVEMILGCLYGGPDERQRGLAIDFAKEAIKNLDEIEVNTRKSIEPANSPDSKKQSR